MLDDHGQVADVTLAPRAQHLRYLLRTTGREHHGSEAARESCCRARYNRTSLGSCTGSRPRWLGLQLRQYAPLFEQCIDEIFCCPVRHGTFDIGAVDRIRTRNTPEQTGIWIAHGLSELDQVDRLRCCIDQPQIA